MTSPNLVPFCLAPEIHQKKQSRKEKQNKTFTSLPDPQRPRLAVSKCQALTQVKVVRVEQELGQVEKLGNELLDVGHVVFGGGEPGLAHAVEHPVGQVEVTPLVVT